MTPRDLVGVVVRSAALIAMGYALWMLSIGAVTRIGIMRDLEGNASDYLAAGFALLMASLALLLAAPMLVALAYGQRTDDAPRPLRQEEEQAKGAGERPSEAKDPR